MNQARVLRPTMLEVLILHSALSEIVSLVIYCYIHVHDYEEASDLTEIDLTIYTGLS